MNANDVFNVLAVMLLLAAFFFLFRWCFAVLFPVLTFGQTMAAATLFTCLVGVASKD